jgi:hypothetical protein
MFVWHNTEIFVFERYETMKKLELLWTRLKKVTTNRTPDLIGKKTDFICRIRQEIEKQNPKFSMERHCFIHQQLLCGETLKSEFVMKVIVLAVTISTTDFI